MKDAIKVQSVVIKVRIFFFSLLKKDIFFQKYRISVLEGTFKAFPEDLTI